MKEKLVIGISLMLVLTSVAITPILTAHDESDPYVTDLIAGQHIDAGTVSVWNDGNDIHVKYETTSGWVITESHLYIGKTNPSSLTSAPGQFPYSDPDESTQTMHSYVIDLDDVCSYQMKLNKKGNPTGQMEAYDPGVDEGDVVYIAAHAVVCKLKVVGCGLDELVASLPVSVTVTARHAMYIPPYNQAYFKVVISGGTSLDGTYGGWCVDLDSSMHDNVPFLAKVYSSLGVIPAGLLGYPNNIDLVNYVINQHYIGKTSSGCGGVYTYGDVQRAIWKLIDEHTHPDTSWLGPWSMCRADEIVADAIAHGEGFVPDCENNDAVSIILEPVNQQLQRDLTKGQICIIEVPIPSETEEGCETAWGLGTEFSTNWAMCFEYTIQ